MSVFINNVGLSVSEDKIQLVEIANRENELFLENVDEEYFEEAINIDTKESKFIHILQNAFNEIVLRKPIQSTKISIALSSSFFKIVEIPIDKNLTKNDLNDYIVWELNKLFPYTKKKSFTFRKVVLNTEGFLPYKRILIYALPTEFLQRLHKFCVRNNLQLKFVDNTHTALSGFLTNEAQDILLSLFIENFRFSALLYLDNNLLFERNRAFSNINEISGLVSEFLNDTNLEQFSHEKIKSLYLFGSSVTKELKNNLGELLNVEVDEIDPFENLSLIDNLKESNFINHHSSKFLPATAIALRI